MRSDATGAAIHPARIASDERITEVDDLVVERVRFRYRCHHRLDRCGSATYGIADHHGAFVIVPIPRSCVILAILRGKHALSGPRRSLVPLVN
jgi:hypothetical protein